MLDFNIEDIKGDDNQFAPLADGKYCAVVVAAEDGAATSKAGHDYEYVNVQFKIVGGANDNRRVFKRFRRTRQQLRKALGIEAQPLPVRDDSLPYFGPPKPVVLSHIEAELFGDSVKAVDGQGIVNLIEAPNRAAEAREDVGGPPKSAKTD